MPDAPATATAPIVFGDVLASQGGEGDPIHVELRSYTRGPDRGRVWIATLSSAAALTVVPSREPAPLARVIAAVTARDGDFVAINGGFYDARGAMGVVLTSGQSIAPFRRGGGSGVVVSTGGTPRLVHRDDYAPSQRDRWALQSIDRLVIDGAVLVKEAPGASRDARSAIALDDRGNVLLVVAFDERAIAAEKEGRVRLDADSSTTGPTLGEFAVLLATQREEGGLGAVWALNLDGGLSTSFESQVAGTTLGATACKATINALLAVGRVFRAPCPDSIP